MEDTTSGYCRLCAALKPASKMIDLQQDLSKRSELTGKLARINSIGDFDVRYLPQTVCFQCLEGVDQAYNLVHTIDQAQSVLHDILLVQHVKKEDSYHSDNDFFDQCTSETSVEIKYENASVKLEKEDLHESKLNNIKSAIKVKNESRKCDLDTIPLSHLKLTWKDYDWNCAYCGTQFPTVEELQNHSIQYHECCNAYRCTDCNIRKLNLNNFMKHVRVHKKYLRLSCYKCFKQFKTSRLVNLHKKVHVATLYNCNGCNTSFDSDDKLKEHMSSFFRDRKQRLIPENSISDDGLSCLICNKSFKYKNSLGTHLLTHTDRKRDHTCDKCGKCFLNKQSLEGHMIVHADIRPHQCEICKNSFKSLVQLRNHVGVHNGVKPYACDQCGKCFRLQKHLASHSIVHTDALPFVCTYCNKSFRFKTILNQHVRQHTGVKPYACIICQREFTNWPNYNKHMKRRHSMNMAKKKHTPEGVCPINQDTGEVIIFPETNKTIEWKSTILKRKGPGRPKKCNSQEEKPEEIKF